MTTRNSYSRKRPKSGLFITFEGIDGSGKSTQGVLAAKYLKEQGLPVIAIREPGSAKLSEKIRSVLLDHKLQIDAYPELLLYLAARGQLVVDIIIPALVENKIVLCDRFHDSTVAYQGYGRKLDLKFIEQLRKKLVGSVMPDLTLIYDLDLETSLTRRKKTPDRLEKESAQFFKRTRAGFRKIASENPERVKLLDARLDKSALFEKTKRQLDNIIKTYRR